tara:strand:- start:40810 stop:41520 length:711 start_codon:yes stop_codon:yes gene_type:complete
MKIAIVVPFFNEKDNLIFFINEWEKFLETKKKLRNILYFYFINDGSTDHSVKKIQESVKKLKFQIINKKNSGHGDSCKFGYNLIVNKYKNFDYLLQIDSDNQCDPKYITKFCNLAKNKKFDFIFGFRRSRADGYLRILISRMLSITFFIKKFLYIKDLNTPYRLMKTSKLKKILLNINKNKKYNNIKLFNCVLSYEIATKYNINWTNINFRDRKFGVSKFKLIEMLKMYLNLLIKI